MNEKVEWFQIAFFIGEWSINVGQIIGMLLVLAAALFLLRIVNNRVLPWYYSVDHNMASKEKNRIRRKLYSILLLALFIIFLIILQFDYILYTRDTFVLRISTLLEGILIIQIARLLDLSLIHI